MYPGSSFICFFWLQFNLLLTALYFKAVTHLYFIWLFFDLGEKKQQEHTQKYLRSSQLWVYNIQLHTITSWLAKKFKRTKDQIQNTANSHTQVLTSSNSTHNCTINKSCCNSIICRCIMGSQTRQEQAAVKQKTSNTLEFTKLNITRVQYKQNIA